MCQEQRILLQINAALNKGSTGRIAEQIASLTRAHKWDTYIVHGARFVNESKMKTMQSVSLWGERLHAVKSMIFDAHGLGSTRATRRVIQEIERIHPDIIHLHNIHGYYLNYKVLFEYLRTINIPVVWTLHDCWPMTGHCSHFDAVGCERWRKECYSCPLKGDYPKSLLFDCSRRNYNLKKQLFTSIKNLFIVPVSQWLGGIVRESFLGNYPCLVINNGVDVQMFRPRENNTLRIQLGIGDKCVLLGVATAWKDDKGLQEFIRLSRNPKYQVVLVGVPNEMKLQLPQSIIVIGRTNNQQELAEYYSMADLLVNPTYNDSFPTVNLEALSCGTPIVTYRTGGSPEAVTDEVGIVVDKGDYRALEVAIDDVLSKGKSYYTKACRRRAVSLYDKDERFKDYLELYERLCLNNRE